MFICDACASLFPDLQDHRRALHQIAELSLHEHATQRYLRACLEQLHPDSLEACADTGLRVVFEGTSRAIAFRSDMDALPIVEATEATYKSEHPGCMHACGHDGHMSMLLAFAKLVAAVPKEERPTVVLLFQPAEETVGGTQRMIEQGALENPHVEAVFGLHMMPTLQIGRIGLHAGPLMAQNVEFDIHITGSSSHGAMPHLGSDALSAAVTLYGQMQQLLTRSIPPLQPLLLSVGHFTAGDARNIVPADAHMECMVRTFNQDSYQIFEQRLKDMIRGLELSQHVQVKFEVRAGFPPVVNDAQLVAHARSWLGEDIAVNVEPQLTAEDFAFFQQQRPGLFAFVGCADATHHAPLHNDHFDFDEHALLYGLETYNRVFQAYKKMG